MLATYILSSLGLPHNAMHSPSIPHNTVSCTVDVERFAGLNVHNFNLTEVFAEILSNCIVLII